MDYEPDDPPREPETPIESLVIAVEPPAPGEPAALVLPPGFPPAQLSTETDLPTPADPAADRHAQVLERLDALRGLIDREIRAEATREKIVDRLHAELQEYKNDLLLKMLRPVLVDLIQLHDDMGKLAAAVDAADPASERVGRLVAGFQQGVEDILYRQGVEAFRVDGEAFDPRQQRAVSAVPNDDPARSRTIAARLRPGFRLDDRVIRPEVVSVHAAAAEPPG
jgi:molecular chaperone GrpE